MLIILFLTFMTVAICLSQILSYRRLRKHVLDGLHFKPTNYKPKVAVILPCKGLDHDFAGNVRKLLDQDYSSNTDAREVRFEVIFTVASEDDPAYRELETLIENGGPVKARLVVAGFNPQRAQKVNNQLEALKHISPDVEVLVFVDSDMVARRDFLHQLVARLEDPAIGATTGYRFYMPGQLDCPSLLQSLWNRMSAWELANPALSFAWGGAMAVRRSVFEAAGVAAAWQKSADDDLSLTCAVKRLGLSIYFVPQCLVATHGNTTFAEFFEWMNRQMILTKVYYPELWQRAIVRAAALAVWLLTLTAVLAGGIIASDASLLTAGMIALLILPFEVCMVVQAQRLWRLVLSDYESNLSRLLWATCLGIPLAHIVLPWMTLYSLLTNRIQWRGVTYELKSPTETVVV